MRLHNNLTGTELGVFYIPGRKKPTLAIKKGAEITVYAVFNTELSAVRFMNELTEFFNIPKDGKKDE